LPRSGATPAGRQAPDGCYPKVIAPSCVAKRPLPSGVFLKVLFATTEFAPLIKTGGLADVSGSLPAALAALGTDVRVLLPAYPAVLKQLGLDSPPVIAQARVGGVPAVANLPEAHLLAASGPHGLPMLLVYSPALFDRPGNPYLGPDGRDWPDNVLRFGLFSRVAALLATETSPLAWRPDVLHCQDWQSGLAPVYLAHSPGRRAGSLMTIHNLAYQGIFPADAVSRIALPPAAFAVNGAEFYGNLSFLKGGLACADAISTVSPTYAHEICTDALGFGLQGLLRARAGVLTGILNGVDTDYWNPATDPLIAQHYDADRLEGKLANKRALQLAMGLEPADGIALLGLIGRLVEQKGIDLVADIIARAVDLPVQFAIQGLGDRALEQRLVDLARQFPGKVGVRVAFDEALAHLVEAGADIFLMPSRFEPCGMNQMYSQRYGTLPLVCRTGGLADSVVDCTPQTLADGSASGFSFAPPASDALLATVQRALELYRDREAWRRVQLNAMARDVSWRGSARQYLRVYEQVAAHA